MSVYEEQRRTSLTQEQLAGLAASSKGPGSLVETIVVDGRCPRCEHPIHQPVLLIAPDAVPQTASSGASTTQALRQPDNAAGPTGSTSDQNPYAPIVVTCRCAEAHFGRPSNEGFGCGLSFLLDVEFAPGDVGGTVTLRNPSDASLAQWWELEEIAQSPATKLGATQTAAGSWQKALLAITGTVSVTALIGGRDALTKLPDGWRYWVAILWALATAGGALSAGLAYAASIGVPGIRQLTTRRQIDDEFLTTAGQAESAVRNLRGAIWVGSSALLIAVTAVVVLWCAPTKPPQLVQVKDDKGSLRCGELLSADSEKSSGRLRGSDGTIEELSPGKIVMVSAVDKCP